MEERDRMQIEKYFAHELSAQEKNAMEQRLTTDSGFAIEFEAYRQAVEALKIAQREELKDRFRARDKVLDNPSQPVTKNFRYIWLLAAALIVMVLGIWVVNNSRGPVVESEIVTPQDTLNTQELSKTEQDTLKTQELPKTEQDNIKSREKIPMASGDEKEKDKWNTEEYDGEELYAANFEPYMDESMDPTSRSDVEDMTDYEKFEYYYWERDHANVVTVFSRLEPAYRKNDNLKFLYANSLMATNRTDEAGTIMKEVMQNKKSLYHAEAVYYVALINIQQENFEEARNNLETYLEDPKAMQTEKANLLLNTLDK